MKSSASNRVNSGDDLRRDTPSSTLRFGKTKTIRQMKDKAIEKREKINPQQILKDLKDLLGKEADQKASNSSQANEEQFTEAFAEVLTALKRKIDNLTQA